MNKRRQCPNRFCQRQYGPDYVHPRCGTCGSKLHSPEAQAKQVKRIESKRQTGRESIMGKRY